MLHIGQGKWVIVDSCVDPSDPERRSVAERYLRALNVDLERDVALIVATHWHSDHIYGMGRLVELCKGAQFSCAIAMLKDEFVQYIEEMATGAAATDGAKVSEFRSSIHAVSARDGTIKWANSGRRLYTLLPSHFGGRALCTITSLSPSDREFELFLSQVSEDRPAPNSPKRAAERRTPNLGSVVLHVEFEGAAVLLGADMEAHHKADRGWTAAVRACTDGGYLQSSVIKVPHHGSITGHHDDVWTKLMDASPLAIVTPFNRLSDAQKLPKRDDLERIAASANELYLTAPTTRGSTSRYAPAVERGLRESNIAIRKKASSLGLVRCRKLLGNPWRTEVFEPAAKFSGA